MVQIHIRGVSIEFPFTPYDCQVSYMEKVIQCLQEVRCIFRVLYLGVITCELFLCFAPFVFLSFVVLTSLFPLLYVTREFHRFLHRG